MSKSIENAEKLYNSFINKQSEKDFFIGLADYYTYLEKNPELLACFIPEIEKANEIKSVLKNAETLAITEFKETLEKVKKDVKKNGFDTNQYLLDRQKEIEMHFDGRISSSAPLLSNVYFELVDIVSFLVKENKLEDVRKYARLYEKNNPVILDRVLLSQIMTKNCKRLQINYNYYELNTKNTQRQTTTIKLLWHKYYLLLAEQNRYL